MAPAVPSLVLGLLVSGSGLARGFATVPALKAPCRLGMGLGFPSEGGRRWGRGVVRWNRAAVAGTGAAGSWGGELSTARFGSSVCPPPPPPGPPAPCRHLPLPAFPLLCVGWCAGTGCRQADARERAAELIFISFLLLSFFYG